MRVESEQAEPWDTLFESHMHMYAWVRAGHWRVLRFFALSTCAHTVAHRLCGVRTLGDSMGTYILSVASLDVRRGAFVRRLCIGGYYACGASVSSLFGTVVW